MNKITDFHNSIINGWKDTPSRKYVMRSLLLSLFIYVKLCNKSFRCNINNFTNCNHIQISVKSLTPSKFWQAMKKITTTTTKFSDNTMSHIQ